VVHDDHQELLVRPGVEQPRPDRQLGRQIERVLRRLPHGIRHLASIQPADLQLPVQVLRVEDVLVGLAVGAREDRSQRLVPHDHIPQRLLHRRGIHVSAQADRRRDVVRRARAFELGQEPEPLLGERQRHPLRTCRNPQRGTDLPRVLCQQGRKSGHRRGLEQRPDPDLHAQHRADPRYQPNREQ
jgi:hypothetical protein